MSYELVPVRPGSEPAPASELEPASRFLDRVCEPAAVAEHHQGTETYEKGAYSVLCRVML